MDDEHPPADGTADVPAHDGHGTWSTDDDTPRTRAEIQAEKHRRRHRRRPSARVRRNRVIALFLVLGLGLLALVVAPGVWFWYQLDPPGGTGDAVAVRIEDGWGVKTIGDELSNAGVIGSPLAFQIYTGATRAGPFQAGEYELAENLGVRGAARELEDGPDVTFDELAVPPGLRLDEIAALVGELPGRSTEAFIAAAGSGVVRSAYQPDDVTSLEGLMFPDTYFVADHEDETDILRTMVERFDEVATGLDLTGGSAALGITPYEAVIVASLIESETSVVDEGPLVAAVVYNRLGDDMRLQIDATVLYAIGERRLQTTDAERLTDSPYNTYVTGGLPPTPISSVTEASLDAALHPADVDYRFYVLTDDDGHHAFAETFEEHEVNVADSAQRGLLG